METETLISLLTALGVGGLLGWWLTERVGLELAHRHRVIEEHQKKLHQYTEKYYLKLCSGVAALEGSLAVVAAELVNTGKSSPITAAHSLFYLARLTKLQEKIFQSDDFVLFLKDWTVEKVLGRLQGQAESLLFSGTVFLSPEDDALIRKQVEIYESLVDFWGKIAPGKPLEVVGRIYQSTVTDPNNLDKLGELIKCLGCWQKLFIYELNICYAPWYTPWYAFGRRPWVGLKKEEWQFLKETLEEMEREGELSAEEVKSYWHKITGINYEELEKGLILPPVRKL